MVKSKKEISVSRPINIRVLSKISNKGINEIEKIISNGDSALGSKLMKDFLTKLISSGLSSMSIGKMIGKDRHVLYKWYKRYKIDAPKYDGFKKAILKTTLDQKRHDVLYSYSEKVNGKPYRVYYIYPNIVFSYMLGLTLGDGHADDRKIYIAGGKPYNFLDSIYPIAIQFGEYLGNRKVKIKYFDKKDKETERENPNATYWRIYIYWSALSHFIRNKEALKEALVQIFQTQELFNSFAAGLFDADGYFVIKHKKPVRIGIQQSKTRWWFPSFYNELKKRYSAVISERKRAYKIENRGKVYEGINVSYLVEFKMSSWGNFINSIMIYSKKPIYHERSEWFKSHALKMRGRWH